MRKLLGFIWVLLLLTLSNSAHSQFELKNTPISVDVTCQKKDSLLVVTYKNTSKQNLALWVGDWEIDFIANEYNYSLLARPIKNSLFFYKKKGLREQVFNYYTDVDTNRLLSLKGYRYLKEGQSFVVKIKGAKTLLGQYIRKLKAWITVSVIDIDYLSQFLMSFKGIKLCRLSICNFDTDTRLFTGSEISISDVVWPHLAKGKRNKLSSIDLPFIPDPKRTAQLFKLNTQNGEGAPLPSVSAVELFHRNYFMNVSLKPR